MATGRYAPTPSADLHIGNLRTALAAWLFARSAGSRFLMRVEDLEPRPGNREVAGRQLADLAAIGIDWDGPVALQSERRGRHDEVVAALVDAGATYPCFCTRREIREAVRAPHAPPGAYPGTCRSLTGAERAARAAEGRPAAIRLRSEGQTVAIEDRLRGVVAGVVDDIVLRRNDGVPAYHLAVVVDDHDQEVEEVVRGDDLLEVTPSQAHLCDLLGFDRPVWAHVPLVLGVDGRRLAKRHGAATLGDLTTAGWSVSRVRSLLAGSLGLAEPGEPVTMADVLARFDPAAIPTGPWTLDATTQDP